jgi:bacillithiol system protein YtxJ
MNWKPLESVDDLSSLILESNHTPQLIFKHSTRCSISVMVKNRLEREFVPSATIFHHLDLLNFRPISAAIADRFQVQHESPQALLIYKEECIFDESHNAIAMDEIIEQLPK